MRDKQIDREKGRETEEREERGLTSTKFCVGNIETELYSSRSRLVQKEEEGKQGVTEFWEFLKRNDLTIDFIETHR